MRITTWNLENLFTPNAGAGAPTRPESYDAKVAALAETLTELGPDVVGVQEVGTPAALDDLTNAIGGIWHTALGDPDKRGIRCGIISRHPLREVEQVAAFPPPLNPVQVDDAGGTVAAFGRPALKATFTLRGTDVHFISVHLKSKLLSFPHGRFTADDEEERARYAAYAAQRRAAEAAAVRAYITALLTAAGPGANAATIVAGCLNDEVEAATTQILLGPPGSELGTPSFNKPDSNDPQRLWNLAPLIPERDRFSRVYRGRRELIDHILVSSSLVHDVAGAAAWLTAVPSIADDPNARRNEAGSDHRPVYADIVV